MIDSYVYGPTSRISPEAPVPVVRILSEENVLGGAANTANNLATLGSKVVLFGIIGNDKDGQQVINILKRKKIGSSLILKDPSRPTTIKKRVISGNNYQLIRLDYEKTIEISQKLEETLFDNVKKSIKKIDAIIISDYDKGVITEKLTKSIIRLAKANKNQ